MKGKERSTCCWLQHLEKLVPQDGQVRVTEAGRQVWAHRLKDWFKESRVTTALHHPTRPLFHRAARAGQVCVFISSGHPLRGKKEKGKEDKGGEKRQQRETRSAMFHCQMSLWVWQSVTSLRSKESTAGRRWSSRKFSFYCDCKLAVWRLHPKPEHLQSKSNYTKIFHNLHFNYSVWLIIAISLK